MLSARPHAPTFRAESHLRPNNEQQATASSAVPAMQVRAGVDGAGAVRQELRPADAARPPSSRDDFGFHTRSSLHRAQTSDRLTAVQNIERFSLMRRLIYSNAAKSPSRTPEEVANDEECLAEIHHRLNKVQSKLSDIGKLKRDAALLSQRLQRSRDSKRSMGGLSSLPTNQALLQAL